MVCCSEKKMKCVTKGCHVYKAILAAEIAEELVCTREATTVTERYAITVMNEETMIGRTLTKKDF